MPARRRRIQGLIFAVGLLAALGAYGRQWRCGDLPAGPACTDGAFPVQIESWMAGDCGQLRFLAESWPPGTVLSLVDADGRRFAAVIGLREGPAALLLTGFSGLVFLAAAAAFFLPRSGQAGADTFFWITFLYGVAIMAGGVFFPREEPVATAAVSLVQIACLAALPVVFLHLALTFPRRSERWSGRRGPLPAAAAAGTAVALWHGAAYLRYARAPGPDLAEAMHRAHAVGDVFMVALTLAGVAVFAVRSRSVRTDRERRQLRWLLWGFAIGAAPYVFLRTLPGLLGMAPLLPASFDRVVELAIPVAFVGAVVWDRFLDIDVIIRRSLLYGLLAAALLVVYLVGGLVFGRWLATARALDPWLLPVVLGLGAGIAFMPLRRALGVAIDRTFFKLASGYDRTLADLDLELAGVADRSGLVDAVLRCVRDTLDPRGVAVAVEREGRVLTEGDGDLAAVRACQERGWATADVVAAPRSTSSPDRETPAFPPELAAAGFVVVQPFAGREGPAGAVYVGVRSTGRAWIHEDLGFLAACGRLAGAHLERIVLQQAVVAETLARERLAELDGMKTEFLAQVAHDLRTPVTGISWSARNLLDGLAGAVTPDQREYLEVIAGSSAHLDRLVDNLLEISRLDRAEITLERTPFAPGPLWLEAARLVMPQARAKRVDVTVTGADAAPTVAGDRSKMIEVAMNILDNAVKYTAEGSAVDVVLAAADGGALAMAVRDHGPGLGGQQPQALFARFAQGRPSPHSTRKGFGLGLHIAATYMECMGGALEAADHADGGAVFTCRLPVAGAKTAVDRKGMES
jgi:signal transduction histidine kinase